MRTEELKLKLKELVESIEDEGLRELVMKVLEEGFAHEEVPDPEPVEEVPASRRQHHSYPGGLLEHTVATTKLALAMAEVFEEIYGVEVDRDLVIAAAILHDLGKATSYEQREERYKISDFGRRLDHLTLIAAELYARGAPVELIHAVAAHHGRGSPIPPNTPEALIVHLADRSDAEFATEVIKAARNVVRARLRELGMEPTDELVEEVLRRVGPSEIFLTRVREGRDAVRQLVAEILEEIEEGPSSYASTRG
ncbi:MULTISPECIES: 3'-5' exoribonuclease YhaM family protein [unclassified Methanopyrus]|uniref:3'-5' exoribonuclease YhaM family protein n=1 Tax=unclassified Methanopyrus TaxID=2684913 RepID=UPI000B4AC846|nr:MULTISPECIES: 3'-5' exoribonuclease YhaM family protein [unclassified Methanopyrus]